MTIDNISPPGSWKDEMSSSPRHRTLQPKADTIRLQLSIMKAEEYKFDTISSREIIFDIPYNESLSTTISRIQMLISHAITQCYREVYPHGQTET